MHAYGRCGVLLAGEFYYDRQSRELIYLPFPDEDLAEGQFEAWAPQLIAPVLIEAEHVTLDGLSVLHAAGACAHIGIAR